MFFNREGDSLKTAVVKVGHSSNIALRSIKVYRAITFKELENHITNKDISLIVIESIPPKEIYQAEKVIQQIQSLNKPIYLYNNDPDIIELEIGSKYGIEIIGSLSDLQKHISDKLGVDVTTSTEQTATEKEHTEENIEQTETEEEQEQAEEEETEPIETYIQHIEESIQQEEESTEPTETEKQQTEENIEHTTELKQQTEIEKEQTAELKQQIVSLKGEITALTSSKEFIENELELVKSDKDTLEDKIYQLNLEIDSLNGELEVNDNEINTLHNSIKLLKEEIELEYKSNKLTHSLLVSSLDSLTDLDRKLSDSLNEKNELECIQGDLERLVNSSKEKITELEEEIKRIENKYTLEKSEVQIECNKEIERIETQARLERSRIEREYQDELNRLKEELSLANTKSIDIQDIDKITILNREIESLKGHINKLNIDIVNKDRVYKDTLVELERYRGQQHNSIEFNCTYTGRAKVIPVFGSGSYGVTTTAVSIARKLHKAKILYMDMDLANPKADGWFKAQPILDSSSLSDIPNNINKTSLGILIDYGAKFVVDNKSSIIQRVSETKNNVTVDYFGGLYGKLDTHRLKLVDFTYLLNTLGSMYDYIIVDCGKYGLSDASNELIDMFIGIAYKSIVVTPNDRLDTRNMSLKLSQNNIDISKIIWVLNLSESTTVTPVVKKNIMGAIPVIMPLTPSAYGKQTSFDKIPILKDKLLEIISKIQ